MCMQLGSVSGQATACRDGNLSGMADDLLQFAKASKHTIGLFTQ